MELADIIDLTNCKNCAHFDGEGFCSMPDGDKVAHGFIEHPECLVCMDWTPIDPDAPKEPE